MRAIIVEKCVGEHGDRLVIIQRQGTLPRYDNHLQVVAVDWTFSSRIKFVGLKPILVTYRWWVGPGLFLTFWRSLGGSLGEHVVFKKNTCLVKIVGKIVKMCLMSNNAISNPLVTKK